MLKMQKKFGPGFANTIIGIGDFFRNPFDWFAKKTAPKHDPYYD